MPLVLHALPADASLSCPGLEDWIDLGRGFMPILSMAGTSERWRLYPRLDPPATPGPWLKLKRLAMRRPCLGNGWVELLTRERVGVVHLHDMTHGEELVRAARHLGLPVVISWPRGADPDFPYWDADRILAPTAAVADRLAAAGCPPRMIRLAPPPLAALRPRRYPAPAKGQGVRWVSAIQAHDRGSLVALVEAFAALSEARPEDTLRLLTAGTIQAEAERRLFERGLARRAAAEAVGSADALRGALMEADAAVFPLVPAEPESDCGLTWPAWLAASAGLPLVLGREGATDGFGDHQQALLAEATGEALGKRMQFLAMRPYIWEQLGREAQRMVEGQLAYERACEIPLEVYRQLLGAEAATREAALG